MFFSQSRSRNDYAAVFEHDGETGYFYLYKLDSTSGNRIIGAMAVLSALGELNEDDITIRWTHHEEIVGLFVRDRVWAAFDVESQQRYGGQYTADAAPAVPESVVKRFAMRHG